MISLTKKLKQLLNDSRGSVDPNELSRHLSQVGVVPPEWAAKLEREVLIGLLLGNRPKDPFIGKPVPLGPPSGSNSAMAEMARNRTTQESQLDDEPSWEERKYALEKCSLAELRQKAGLATCDLEREHPAEQAETAHPEQPRAGCSAWPEPAQVEEQGQQSFHERVLAFARAVLFGFLDTVFSLLQAAMFLTVVGIVLACLIGALLILVRIVKFA